MIENCSIFLLVIYLFFSALKSEKSICIDKNREKNMKKAWELTLLETICHPSIFAISNKLLFSLFIIRIL